MLEQGRHSMDVIANEVGFSDRDRMRHAFLRTLGQPPQAIRRFGKESRVPSETPNDDCPETSSQAPDAKGTPRTDLG
jgi:AraC-like DNA-binding protein